jgi:hypothetical protein
MSRNIEPFHITIGPALNDGGFAVRCVSRSGVSETRLLLPAEVEALAMRALRGDSAAAYLEDGVALGRELGRALITGAARDLLFQSARAAAQASCRLQIQLQLGDPSLTPLPWEWLSIGAERAWIPALRDHFPLVRVVRFTAPIMPRPVDGPIGILVLGAATEREQLDALEIALRGPVQAGSIVLRRLIAPMADDLRTALTDDLVHIIHCAAPVVLDSDDTIGLMLGERIDSDVLLECLDQHPDIRLVTITGRSGAADQLDAGPVLLAALALGLTRPAAISMNGPIPADASARFAGACYGALAEGQPIDLAVTEGRKQLERGQPCWGMVQLRIAADTSALFTIAPSTDAATRRSLVIPIIALAIFIGAAIIIWRLLAASITLGPMGAPPPGAGWW